MCSEQFRMQTRPIDEIPQAANRVVGGVGTNLSCYPLRCGLGVSHAEICFIYRLRMANPLWIRTTRGHIVYQRSEVNVESRWNFVPGSSRMVFADGHYRETPAYSEVGLSVPILPRCLVTFHPLSLHCLSVAPWIRQLRLHFSLRTLLFAMTLIAIVLGLVVWATR